MEEEKEGGWRSLLTAQIVLVLDSHTYRGSHKDPIVPTRSSKAFLPFVKGLMYRISEQPKTS